VTSDTPRPALTRDRIVQAAVALIEREGAEALSMRRVAAELDVAVMSLYNHVPNKTALLEGVAERVVEGLELGDDPGRSWQEGARALVRAFRKVAHDYPRCMTIVLTHKVDTAAGLRPMERALALADAAGFDAETAVRTMRALLAYAIGAQVREVGMEKMLGHLAETGAESWNRLDPEEFPHVIAYGPQLAAHDPESDFEFGLDLLIAALEALPRRPAGKPGPGTG
jgi:AcrR family transcriptional regulator